MTWWRQFSTALTFLTRLGRADIVSQEEISASVRMYPVVGIVVGLLWVSALVSPFSSWISAWLLVMLNIWLTRGLHWDGWADLWDGWGSGAMGERFWEILKDSRVGAFGVMGLVCGLGMQAALLERAVFLQTWSALLPAPVFGRYCAVILAGLGKDLARPGLGQNVLAGATPGALAFGGAVTLIAAFFSSAVHFACSILLAAFVLFFFLRLGRRHQGLNGDFFGAVIVAGEFCVLLPPAVLS
jgi:adenosylcobinamide-GDP ribazoletransferase